MRIIVPLLLAWLLLGLGAALTAGSRARRGVGVLMSVSSLVPAWWVPAEHTLVRPMWVLVAFAGLMRAVDLRVGEWPLASRLRHLSSIVDSRLLVAARPAVDGPAIARGLAWEVVAAGSYAGLVHVGRPDATGGWLTRFALALVFVYTFSAGAYLLLRAAYRAAGFIVPPLHESPALSRSVQEFWGERWNLTVSRWLGATFFRPLARLQHPLLGACLAFVASAAIHAYLAWIGTGLTMAACTLAFFLLQAVLVLLERRLRVRAWPAPAGHAWAIAWMASLSPLFTEPMVRSLGL